MDKEEILEAQVSVKGPREVCELVKDVVLSFVKLIHDTGIAEYIDEIKIMKYDKSELKEREKSINDRAEKTGAEVIVEHRVFASGIDGTNILGKEVDA